MSLLQRTHVGRDINRRYYDGAAVREALSRPVVRSLMDMLRLRNTHRAFGGTFESLPSPPERLTLVWRNGQDAARLDVDLATMSFTTTCS
jgi:sucrose phosphorylase